MLVKLNLMLRYTITVRTPFTKDDVFLDVDDDDKCVVMMMLLFSLFTRRLHTIFSMYRVSLLLVFWLCLAFCTTTTIKTTALALKRR